MITAEPDRSPYDLNFRLFGFPVRVHPFFWVVTVILGISGSEVAPLEMLMWVVAVFVSILVHELGHAFAARYFGYEPWITLHGFGGLASYDARNLSPGRKILISLAGPGAGFAFAALLVATIAASGRPIQLVPSLMPIVFRPFASSPLTLLVIYLLFVNIIWGLVNLLPVYPLDGGQISREIFTEFNPYQGIRYSLIVSMVVAALVGVYAIVSGELYVGLMFGYLGYISYTTLQAYTGRGGGGAW